MPEPEPPQEQATFPFQLPPGITEQLDVQYRHGAYYVHLVERVQPADPAVDLAVWMLVTHNKEFGVATSSLYYAEWITPGQLLLTTLTEYSTCERLPAGAYVLRMEREIETTSELAQQLERAAVSAGILPKRSRP